MTSVAVILISTWFLCLNVVDTVSTLHQHHINTTFESIKYFEQNIKVPPKQLCINCIQLKLACYI